MARMRVVSINKWGEKGIQVNFETIPPAHSTQVNYTKMSTPDNAEEFKHLMDIRLYDEFDVEAEKVTTLI